MKHIQSKCTTTDCGGTCYPCTISICSVCMGCEGSLTTECCGEKLPELKTRQIYNDVTLDFITEKGWHNNPAHKTLWDRVAIFEDERDPWLDAPLTEEEAASVGKAVEELKNGETEEW